MPRRRVSKFKPTGGELISFVFIRHCDGAPELSLFSFVAVLSSRDSTSDPRSLIQIPGCWWLERCANEYSLLNR